MREKRYAIIGGGKTAVNLKAYFDRKGISNQLYYFDSEYASKKEIGQLFDEKALVRPKSCIITSETAFQHMPNSERAYYKNHYYLRDKRNLVEIAHKVRTNSINELDRCSQLRFPVIAKPEESSGDRVPFKFKVINNQIEFNDIGDLLDFCILQPYLDKTSYNQLAVAGYFDGTVGSLIAAKQFSQYPIGISAFVVDVSSIYSEVMYRIAMYLNNIDYRGFIEFEFKENKLDGTLYLMDINPRTWGWSNYYLEGVQNFSSVLKNKESIQLKLKKAWVNVPRWMLSLKNGTFATPKLRWLVKNQISFEPYF
jgi:predicted ATP-grasp superfamily ATP-dependent carboligase